MSMGIDAIGRGDEGRPTKKADSVFVSAVLVVVVGPLILGYPSPPRASAEAVGSLAPTTSYPAPKKDRSCANAEEPWFFETACCRVSCTVLNIGCQILGVQYKEVWSFECIFAGAL
jgi:hypothetical protein